MGLEDLKQNWDAFGKADPMWAILAAPDKKGRKWQAGEFFETGVKEIGELLAQLDSFGLRIPRRRALDFGCGIGRLTQALGTHFDEVYGLDIAPSMIQLAEHYNRWGSKCKYLLNETAALDRFEDSTFDLIYSYLALQHIEPKYSGEYLREFVRVLAPGGVLVFQLPSVPAGSLKQTIKRATPAAVLRTYRWIRYGWRPTMGMHGIERGEVTRLLENNGAEVVKTIPDQNAPGWVGFRYYVTKP